ncbi:hypothetical protein N9M66_07030 [Litoreibacter sp.]|nr:hypothetical protein [Litoreibacter sp.]
MIKERTEICAKIDFSKTVLPNCFYKNKALGVLSIRNDFEALEFVCLAVDINLGFLSNEGTQLTRFKIGSCRGEHIGVFGTWQRIAKIDFKPVRAVNQRSVRLGRKVRNSHAVTGFV